MKSNLVISPAEPPASPPAGNKGGAGVYDGEKGYPPRSPGAGGPPEKIYDGSVRGGGGIPKS